MKLNNHKKCDRCSELYDTSSFACMLGNGERADAQIEIYGDKYDLCPKCTYETWKFLHKSRE